MASTQVPVFSSPIEAFIGIGVTVGSSGSPSKLESSSVTSVGSSEVSVIISLSGSVPVVVATLITSPASKSACVRL